MPRDALADALIRLGRCAVTREELRRYLSGRGHGHEEVAAALDRVAALGYLDDLEAARSTVRQRRRSPRSRRVLAAELHRRGVPDEDVRRALEDVDDRSLALEAAARDKARGRRWDQVARSLARRGFSADVTRSVLDEIWPGGPGDPEP